MATTTKNESNGVLVVSLLLFMVSAAIALISVQENRSLPLLAFGLYAALNVISPALYWIEANPEKETLLDIAALLHRVRGVGFYILAFELLLNGGASFFVEPKAEYNLVGLYIGLGAMALFWFIRPIQKQTSLFFLSETSKTGVIFASVLALSSLLTWFTATVYPEAVAGLALTYFSYKEGRSGTAQGRCVCEIKH